MKRQFAVIVLMIIGISGGIMFSCTSGSSDVPNIAMSGFIDGQNWKAVEPRAVISDYDIIISGTSANGQSVILSLNGNITGDYPISFGNYNIAKFIPNTSAAATVFSTNNNTSGTGLVRITAINENTKTINGKFNFIAFKENSLTKKTITEGSFTNVPYTYRSGISFVNRVMYNEEGTIRESGIVNVTKEENEIIVEGIMDRNIAWQSIIIHIPLSIEVGEHSIGPDNTVKLYFQKNFDTYEAHSGTLTVTEHDSENSKIVAGFNFTYDFVNEEGETVPVLIIDGNLEIKYNIDE
ncbi:MAG: hypothetical protein LBQ22_11865 [Bacteroidales bacterium]|jgi:hypothetical protein|nr:hypothetical protein [Bacteroidales bacterium]